MKHLTLTLLFVQALFACQLRAQTWAEKSKELFKKKDFDSQVSHLLPLTTGGNAETRAQAFFELGFAYLAGKKDPDAAQGAFENAAKLNEQSPAPRAALAILCQLKGQWQQLVTWLEPIKYAADYTIGAPKDGASAKFPPRDLVIKTYIYGLANLNQYDKADLYLNKLYLSNGELLHVFELKGDMYMSKSEWTRAAGAYETYQMEYAKNRTGYDEAKQSRMKPSAQLFDRWLEALEKLNNQGKMAQVNALKKSYYP